MAARYPPSWRSRQPVGKARLLCGLTDTLMNGFNIPGPRPCVEEDLPVLPEQVGPMAMQEVLHRFPHARAVVKAPSVNNLDRTLRVGYTTPHANGIADIGEVGGAVATSG